MTFFAQYDDALSDAERELVSKARWFCEGKFSEETRQAHLRGVPFAREWIKSWADEGMLGLQVKPEHGGHGASFICKVRVAQEVARHSFAAAFCLNNLQGQATRLSRAGSDEQRSHLLAGLVAGSILAAPSMSEPSGGSDLGALTTTATPVSGGWLVNGVKDWVTNGTIVDWVSMLVRSGESAELMSLLVPCGAESSVTREEVPLAGGRSFRLAKMTFRDHFVPDWALLGPAGNAVRASMAAVNAARVHVAAMAVATLHSALCEAVRYCGRREALGKVLLAHQGLQWELAEVAARLEAANALGFKAAQLVDRGLPAQTAAAQCKKFAVDTAIWGIDQCIRAMGAVGASDAHRLGMHLAEVRLAAYADGTNEMMLDRIGRGLAKDYGMPVAGEQAPTGMEGKPT
ncbi:acyl-CoA dehydrogenase family protein [Bosea sp. 685]|uniref:acyl-CoA dehydrogenase family protein n=1 Tax=Bosea sp. 685 TaxID=3080057 RepID=UPI00289379F0|nr:acyl-CoA dehydrogenase family protein [Bosea sp. 685]WNJ88010.1 acyl-CoA dehydrogenase family protein [Bosea sp. 685]